MKLDNERVWKDVLESVQVNVSPAIYKTWFTQTKLTKLEKVEGGVIAAEVGCATNYVKDFIENRYFGIIQDSLKKITESSCSLVFAVKQFPSISRLEPTGESAPLFNPQAASVQINQMLQRSRIRPGFTFENYAVSGSNQMAYAAAEAVSKNPGNAYNPLFIYGGVGVGKTHLMVAVGHKILSDNPVSHKTLFATGEEFTNDIVEGIRNKTTPSVRDKYRKLGCLLIDDVQFIAGKDTVQEEFFHTFNAVTSAGGQVILTSDRPPSEIARLEERLRSRFEAGLIVDIANHDFELRCAITQIKARERGLDLAMDLVQTIAGNIIAAREIQGFIVRLASEVSVNNAELSIELIEKLLNKSTLDNGNVTIKYTPEDMISAVSKYFSIGKRVLLGTSRARPVAMPRQILMYLLRRDLKLPLEEVGRVIGRDHTTVMHAVNKITNLASSDVHISEDLMGIKKTLSGKL